MVVAGSRRPFLVATVWVGRQTVTESMVNPYSRSTRSCPILIGSGEQAREPTCAGLSVGKQTRCRFQFALNKRKRRVVFRSERIRVVNLGGENRSGSSGKQLVNRISVLFLFFFSSLVQIVATEDWMVYLIDERFGQSGRDRFS